MGYMERYVSIRDGSSGVTNKIYLNLSDKNGTGFKNGTFFVNITSTANSTAPYPSVSIPQQSWQEGAFHRYQIPEQTFRDADPGDKLTYSATVAGARLPDWLTFNAATRTFSGTPPTGTPDTVVEVKAIDSTNKSATTTFTIVTPANLEARPPEVVKEIEDQTAHEGETFSFIIPENTFADPDPGDVLTYTVTYKTSTKLSDGQTTNPTWLTYDKTTKRFFGTPPADTNDVTVEVKATDLANKSASSTFTIFTPTGETPSNAPKVVTPIQDQTVTEGATLSFIIPEGTFQDQDLEDTLTYTLRYRVGASASDWDTAPPAWLSYDSTSHTLSGTPPANTDDVIVEVTATDTTKKSIPTTFSILTPAAASPQAITGTAGDDPMPGSVQDESFIGLAGNDTMRGGGGNDKFDGGIGIDTVELGATGGTHSVVNVETLLGGAGADVVTLGGEPGVSAIIRVSGVETLTGGNGVDIPFLMDAGSTIMVSGLEYLIGGAGTDVVTLGASGGFITVRNLETLSGGGGLDVVLLGDGGNTMLARGGLEYLIGGAGSDVVTLGSGGSTLVVRALETLTGGSGNDFLKLGNSFNVIKLSGIETLAGGFGTDIPFLGDAGSTLTVSGLEYLIGGAGRDVVTLAGAGGIITVRGLEVLTGSWGIDMVFLGDGGNTLLAQSAIEYVIGGAGTDVVTLGSGGSTLIVRDLETVAGGSGVDVLQLGNGINTLTLSSIETLTGGISADTVTVASGAIRFEGGTGADSVSLASGSFSDRVVFRGVDDGAVVGTAVGYDTVAGFSTGDVVTVTGQIGGFVDHNGNGVLQAAARGVNQVNLATDEAFVLSGTLASLSDDGFVNLRTGVGKMAGSTAGTSALAVASTGVDSGVYLITDADGDGWLAANEVRLLGVFTGTSTIGISQLSIG